MNAGPERQSATVPAGPAAVSTAAAEQLPPAYPARAAWGTAARLRAWQAEALQHYLAADARDFLAAATPGAGKTTFALRVATELLASSEVTSITVVAPTEHLKGQWAEAAARVGIHLDPDFRNAQVEHGASFDGVAITYAQVAADPALHRRRSSNRRTLVILDELHHGGDALTWGEGIEHAFEVARRRLGLTGTPFRSDTAAIPFVVYERGSDGVRRSRADYSYGYADALRDGVVRPVIFLSYSGNMRWRTKAGDEVSARLGEPLTKDLTAQAWRTALDPSGDWVPAVFLAADRRLSEVRRAMPDAGGLVIASDQAKARAYAAVLGEISGEPPVLVLSDDEGASERIDEFAAGEQRWMIAVRMVSEGVDVPRLGVGVYATSAATPLFFAQVVGRFVRARRRGETASVFLPSVPLLLQHAAELENQRDHALDRVLTADEKGQFFTPEEQELAVANREERAREDLTLPGFEALEAQASFDKVLFDGGEFGTGAEVGSVAEQDFLGIPGLLEPEQVTELLRAHQADQVKQQQREARGKAQREENAAMPEHRRRAALRKELAGLVSAWSRRSNEAHAVVHTKLRDRCGGPQVAQASSEEIQQRIATLRRWFVGKR